MSHPIPVVARFLATIANVTTIPGLLQISSALQTDPNFTMLVPDDQQVIRTAWAAKRTEIHVANGTIPRAMSAGSLAQTLAAAAQETAGQALGSMADGARRGVGFSDPASYLAALQRGGLQAHTRAEYLATVRRAGLATDDVFPPANATHNATATSDGRNGGGFYQAGDGNQTLMREIQEQRRRNRAANVNSPEARAAAIAAARLAGAKLVGYDGQVTDPNSTDIGTIVAFGRTCNAQIDSLTGRRRQMLIPWGDVEAVRVALKLPEGTFGRAPGSVGILGDAVEILNNGGFVARRIKGSAIPSFENPDVMIPVRSAWKVGFFDNRADSDSMGKREATLALVKDGQGVKLICDNPDHPGAQAVIADYNRRVAGTMIESEDLLTRVEAAFRRVCGARMTDLGCYVSPAASDRAVALANAIRPLMGRNVYCYAHTHAESLQAALTDSITREIDSLELTIAKPEYKASAATITKIEKLKAECVALSGLIGAAAVEGYRARLDAADAKVVEGLNATTQRALHIEMD